MSDFANSTEYLANVLRMRLQAKLGPFFERRTMGPATVVSVAFDELGVQTISNKDVDEARRN
eukprot:14061568-Alexandrium_andersonii.AAC.1